MSGYGGTSGGGASLSTEDQQALDDLVAIPAGELLEEAPKDGTPYVRQDAGWVAAPTGGGASAGYHTVLGTNEVNHLTEAGVYEHLITASDISAGKTTLITPLSMGQDDTIRIAIPTEATLPGLADVDTIVFTNAIGMGRVGASSFYQGAQQSQMTGVTLEGVSGTLVIRKLMPDIWTAGIELEADMIDYRLPVIDWTPVLSGQESNFFSGFNSTPGDLEKYTVEIRNLSTTYETVTPKVGNASGEVASSSRAHTRREYGSPTFDSLTNVPVLFRGRFGAGSINRCNKATMEFISNPAKTEVSLLMTADGYGNDSSTNHRPFYQDSQAQYPVTGGLTTVGLVGKAGQTYEYRVLYDITQ